MEWLSGHSSGNVMKTIANIEFNQLPLSEGIMVVSQCIRHDFPLMKVQAQLDSLVSAAQTAIDLQADNESKIEQLITLFYRDWSFSRQKGFIHCLICCGLIKYYLPSKGRPYP